MPLLAVDWAGMFTPEQSLIGMFLRGAVMYLTLLLFMRVALRRESGTVGVADLLMVILVGESAGEAMAANAKSIPEGAAVAAGVLFSNFVLDWLSYQSGWFERLLRPSPLALVRDGKVLRRNLRQEFITMEELRAELRKQGVDEIADVRLAVMEGDGNISVLKREPAGDDQQGRRDQRAGPV